MIVFIESGRLGNQLFQYAALRTLCREDEKLVLFGFDALRNAFDNPDATFAARSGSLVFRFLRRLRARVDSLVARQALFPVISEVFTQGRCEVAVAPGRVARLRYCREAFFQSEALFDDTVATRLKLKDAHVRAAERLLADPGLVARKKIFVHVRRGDYLHWPPGGPPAALPADWYRECMRRFRQSGGAPFFIVVSDDAAHAREEFGAMPDVRVSAGSEAEDFALMCLCDGGILSASAYSWWAAYFASRRRPEGVFLAPQYWVGHGARAWFPIGVETSFLEYAPVGSGA